MYMSTICICLALSLVVSIFVTLIIKAYTKAVSYSLIGIAIGF